MTNLIFPPYRFLYGVSCDRKFARSVKGRASNQSDDCLLALRLRISRVLTCLTNPVSPAELALDLESHYCGFRIHPVYADIGNSIGNRLIRGCEGPSCIGD